VAFSIIIRGAKIIEELLMSKVFGRQRIRNEAPQPVIGGNPLVPAKPPSRPTRLWTQEAAEGTLLASLRDDAYLAAFGVVDARDKFKADAIKANRFTEDGLREQVKEFSINQTAQLKKARNIVDKALDRVAELEKETALPPPDQSEAASRLRDRTWQQLQRLPEGPTRERAILSLAEKNPLVAEALLEMPRELAGIAASTYDLILQQKLRATHGAKLDELLQLREGIEIASDTIEAADQDLRTEVEVFQPKVWAELTEHVKPAGPIPWLSKEFGSALRVKDMKTRSARLATEEEIRVGCEFKSYEEYAAANGLPPEPPPSPQICLPIGDDMTKPTFTTTDASSAINVANEAIDRQAGGAGHHAKETRAELDRTMKGVDAVIKDQAAGVSGHSKP
jgi:hypothetical protein